MKYNLNKTPVTTTNNFKINDIELELDIPNSLKNFSYKVSEYDQNNINIKLNLERELVTKIGLPYNDHYNLNINIADNYKTKTPLILEYNLDSDLIANINLNIGENCFINIIIKCFNKEKVLHYLKQVTNIKKNSTVIVSLVNLFNDEVTNLVAMESNIEENSALEYNYIDLGGNTKISNYYAKLTGRNSLNNFNNIYFGNNKDTLDMNYYIACNAPKTKANILSEGALKDNSIKSYKGTIDFISGCKGSKGEELENCILLSETAKSKSLPMLLCGEEDVEGSHGVATGKIDKDKIFYLESKGLNQVKATRLIVNGNFNKVLKKIRHEETIELIQKAIESKL